MRYNLDSRGEFSPVMFAAWYLKTTHIQEQYFNCGNYTIIFDDLIEFLGKWNLETVFESSSFSGGFNRDFPKVLGNDNILIRMYILDNIVEFYMYYRDSRDCKPFINALRGYLEDKRVSKQSKSKRFGILVRNPQGMDIVYQKCKLPGIDYNLHYKNLPHQKIVDNLTTDKSGIVYFTGHPGTGKTTYIKSLTNCVDKDFMYLTSNNFEALCDPVNSGFIIENLKNTVLVMEDAEVLLKDRSFGNDIVQNILNWSDGIMGDILNIKMIFTQNNDDQTDPAVLRKGRLLIKHHFDLLDASGANKIVGEDVFHTETSLSDAIFYKENNGVEQKRKIGF